MSSQVLVKGVGAWYLVPGSPVYIVSEKSGFLLCVKATTVVLVIQTCLVFWPRSKLHFFLQGNRDNTIGQNLHSASFKSGQEGVVAETPNLTSCEANRG